MRIRPLYALLFTLSTISEAEARDCLEVITRKHLYLLNSAIDVEIVVLGREPIGMFRRSRI